MTPNVSSGIPSTPSLRSSSSSDSDAEFASSSTEDNLIAAEDAYNTLLSMGGRPVRPVQHDSGPQELGSKNRLLGQYSDEGARLRGELEKWRAFRDYQRGVRRDRASFRRAQQYINAYWQRRGVRQDLKPKLLENPQMQTKLEEWKEFYFHQHQTLEQKEKRVEEAERQARISLKAFEVTESCFQDGMHTEDGWYIAAIVDLETYTAWLAWIEGQIPLISSKCVPENIDGATPSRTTTPDLNLRTKKLRREIRRSEPKSGSRRSARISKIVQMSSVFNQPLRRSVRIAQRQFSGKGRPLL